MKSFKSLLAITLAILTTTSFFISSPTLAKKGKENEEKKEKKHEEHKQQEDHKTTTTTTTIKSTLLEVARTSSCGCSTFIKAVETAGLTQTFAGTTPYTLFVPSDAAFASLPPATLQKLLLPENKTLLQQLLTYHVLAGRIDYKKIKPGKIKTYGGQFLELKYNKKGQLEIGKAKIKKRDLKAKNGYIYVIDTVLLPPGFSI